MALQVMRQVMGDFESLCATAHRLKLKKNATGIEIPIRIDSLFGQR